MPAYLGTKLDWSKWLYGLGAAAIGGGAGAVVAGGAASVVIPGVSRMQAIEVAAITFLVSGFFSLMNFLAREPLPPMTTTTTTATQVTPTSTTTVQQTTETPVVPAPKEEK